jgi:hypothetical protein
MKYIRDIIGRVLVGLGTLCLITPLYSLLHANFHLRATLVAVVVGVLLTFGGIVILRPPNLQSRPRYWGPAISGVTCSICTLLLFVCFFVVYRWPAEKAPDWLMLVTLFLLVVAGLAAVVCIVSGAKAFFRPKVVQDQNEKVVA